MRPRRGLLGPNRFCQLSSQKAPLWCFCQSAQPAAGLEGRVWTSTRGPGGGDGGLAGGHRAEKLDGRLELGSPVRDVDGRQSGRPASEVTPGSNSSAGGARWGSAALERSSVPRSAGTEIQGRQAARILFLGFFPSPVERNLVELVQDQFPTGNQSVSE